MKKKIEKKVKSQKPSKTSKPAKKPKASLATVAQLIETLRTEVDGRFDGATSQRVATGEILDKKFERVFEGIARIETAICGIPQKLIDAVKKMEDTIGAWIPCSMEERMQLVMDLRVAGAYVPVDDDARNDAAERIFKLLADRLGVDLAAEGDETVDGDLDEPALDGANDLLSEEEGEVVEDVADEDDEDEDDAAESAIVDDDDDDDEDDA